MGFVVAAVKVAAAFVAKNVVAKAVVKLAATAIISKVATRAISKLIAKRSDLAAPGGGEGGGRIQLPPATDNKLPVVYGSAWVNGVVTDAKISTNNQTMWYVVSLCEVPASGTIAFDTTNGIYYDGKKVAFVGSTAQVASLTTNTTPAQVDTKVAGKIFIYLFNNGYNSGVNTGGLTAVDILSDSLIPSDLRWNSALYTTGGEYPSMNYVAFAIVRVDYNGDAGTTGLGSLQIKVTNNFGASNGAKPGVALLDYMTDPYYGCDIPLENIDTASLTALDVYADQSISYIDVNGNPQTQPYRYRINGVLDTSNTCMNNLQMLVDACDSWLQYTETTGKWRVVPNAPYSGSLSSLYNVNDDVLLGGIQINPIDLNYTYNQVEVAYPNTNVRDQNDYQIVDLTDPTTSWYSTYNTVLSPNEAINRLNLALPMVNQAVQAKYIAVRRLLQSREDLVINFTLDYSGIQIDAGDVIRVNHNAYGWVDKLFRVNSVNEVQDENGNLMASIEAFEYNGSIYTIVDPSDYVPSDNTGLQDPNVISPPCPPDVIPFTDANALVTGFSVRTCVPDFGTVLYMDFNYGYSSNVDTHQLYKTVTPATSFQFLNSDSANAFYNYVYIDVMDLPAATYYWSATARNNTAGRLSNGSNAYSWGGANIQPWNGNSNTGGIGGNQVKSNTIVLRNFANDLNVRLVLGGENFSIPEGSTQYPNLSLPLLPVDANANTDRNIPINIYGANINANNFFPYANGTATTVTGTDGNNYYAANSTAAWTPNTSSRLLINDGEDNWWKVTYADIAPNTIEANQTFGSSHGINMLTDTPNTMMQFVIGYTSVTFGNAYYECQTEDMFTRFLEDDQIPYSVGASFNWQSSDGPNFTGAACFARCLTPNAKVTFYVGGTALSAGPFPFA